MNDNEGITALSLFSSEPRNVLHEKHQKYYSTLPEFIPKQLKKITTLLSSDDPKKIIAQFKDYLVRSGFSYTLSPGQIPTMQSFLVNKKGYCTHFASLLGVILRLKGIPARLVSGFQGGEYNSIGEYYVIKSNDAHTWVEYFHEDKWLRIDPTGFVSPGRIQLGGTNFQNASADATGKVNSRSQFMALYNQVKLRIDNLNYRVSLYFDNYNREEQLSLSSMLKLKRGHFYFLGLSLIVMMFFIYVYITRNKKKSAIHPIDLYLKSLDKKTSQKLQLANCHTIEQMQHAIGHSEYDLKTKEQLLDFISLYQESRFSKKQNEKKLQESIKKILLK